VDAPISGSLEQKSEGSLGEGNGKESCMGVQPMPFLKRSESLKKIQHQVLSIFNNMAMARFAAAAVSVFFTQPDVFNIAWWVSGARMGACCQRFSASAPRLAKVI